MKIPRTIAVITLFIFLLTLPASADIISASAGVTVLPFPPLSTQLNQLQSNTNIFAFQERLGETLFLPIPVDATDPGSYDTFADLDPAILPMGLTVNSYLLHADPDIPLLPFIAIPYQNRSVTFAPNEQIVGIMVDMFTLRAGDFFLGAPATSYPPFPIFSGLELDIADGPIIISPDRRTVTVNFSVATGLDLGGVDQVRIITTAVNPIPEPLTVALTGVGLAGIACVGALRRRRSKSTGCTI
jgi:hypothetical protein